MPEEYGKAVLAAYQKKKEDESLSSNLLNPTPGNVREECLIIYRERERSSKDDEIFKQFFSGGDKEKGYLTILENSRAQKFKQMPKILKGNVPKPGIKFIELLAWLIDFQPRTSISYYNSFDKRPDVEIREVVENHDDKIEEAHIEVTGGNNNEEQSYENEGITIDKGADKQGGLVKEPIIETTDREVTKQPFGIEEVTKYTEPEYVRIFSTNVIILGCIILLFVGSTSFIAWENSPTAVRMPNSDEKFMYWDGDHYEPIKDEKQDVGAAITPLNIQTLTQQRKINLPDTLTSYSIGKVWYKGHGKDHEFFTAAGVYPPDTVRTLKKLSPGILRDYVSYYRYLLTRLVWFICAAFFIALCGILASRLKKEVKLEDKFQENDIKETLSASEATQVMNEAELKAVQV